MTRRKPPDPADLAFWIAYSRTVTPLPGRTPPASQPPPPPLAPAPAPQEPAAPGRAPPRALVPALPPASLAPASLARATPGRPALTLLAVDIPPPGLDRATWEKFRAGRIAAARTLDLHGHTAARAHHATLAFIRRAHTDRLRCIEIVTGRGAGPEGGVLKREFPLWLNLPDLRPLILAVCHPHIANTGAVRVLLKKSKKEGRED